MPENVKENYNEGKRYTWNIWMFIISFTLSNLISGVIYDTYVNYLQEVSRSVATSFGHIMVMQLLSVLLWFC